MKKLKPVTEEDLIKIFRSKEFRDLLRRSARHTFRTGHECNFAVERDIVTSELYFTKLSKGETGRVRGVAGGEPYSKSYIVVDLHFHTETSGYECCPSEPDLVRLTTIKLNLNVNCRPVCAIGKIDFNERGELFLFQETIDKQLTESFLKKDVGLILNELRDNAASTQDIVDEFNRLRTYKATSLTFKLSNGDVLIPDNELERVRMFAYTPLLLEGESDYLKYVNIEAWDRFS